MLSRQTIINEKEKRMAKIEINKLSKNHTLKVDIIGTRELKIRIKIATFFLKLAGRVLGCGISIDANWEGIQDEEGNFIGEDDE